MKNYRLAVILFLIPMVITCIEPYEPDVKDKNPNYLVVDGFLNSTTGSGVFRLTHTSSLSQNTPPTAEWFSEMLIEGEAGEQFHAVAHDGGIYEFTNAPLQADRKYRMHITTAGGKEYISDYVPVLNSPAIDSITWEIEDDGLNILVNSHDDNGQSRYYRWYYHETWEYITPLTSTFKLIDGKAYKRTPEEYINRCWAYENSTNINVGTTTLLDRDIISRQKLVTIPKGSLKTSVKYSILVRQQVLSEAGYTYWNDLKKTTESLGGLFDPLPSQVVGNFRCIDNPSEPVIGFFEAGNFSEKRIFIKFSDLPNDFSYYQPPYCPIDTILVEELEGPRDPDSLIGEISLPGQLGIIGYSTSEKNCIDCRVLGTGFPYRPSYWE
jgi:hypothetical protein